MTPREQSLQDHRDRIQRELKDAKALPVAREVPRPIPAEPRVPRLRKKKDDPTRLRSGPPPYGLKDGSDAGIEIIKEIFRLAARGWSLRRIRQRLNDRGLPGPKGGEWSRSAISYLLHNEIYRLFVGSIIFNKANKGLRSRRRSI